MAKVKYTPKALEDLQMVKSYIAGQFGTDIAKKGVQSTTTW